MNDGSGAGGTKPGKLMRLVADGLTAHGFDVRPPECADGRRLTIGCPGARCSLTVNDEGDVEWECRPAPGEEADPKRVADLAATLLTGQTGNHPGRGDGYRHNGITFKGAVGLELKARGFDVDLEVYRDTDHFDVRTEIVVTGPGTGKDAQVHVADDGSITWLRDYWTDAGTIVWEPEYRAWIADPTSVANAVVETITQTMSQVLTVT